MRSLLLFAQPLQSANIYPIRIHMGEMARVDILNIASGVEVDGTRRL